MAARDDAPDASSAEESARFLAAVAYGDEVEVKLQLSRSPQLSRAKDAVSSSHSACNGYLISVATFLFTPGLSLSLHPGHLQRGKTALMASSQMGHKGITNLLLTGAKPARPKAVDRNGRAALHYAAINGHASIVRVLLLFGADPRLRCKGGRTAIDEAIEHDKDSVLREILVKFPSASVPPAPRPPNPFRTARDGLTVEWEAQVQQAKPAISASSGGAAPFPQIWRLQIAEADADPDKRRWVTTRLVTLAAEGAAHGLKPDTGYVVRLLVANEFGWSPPSAPSEVMYTRGMAAGAGGGRASNSRCDLDPLRLNALFEGVKAADAHIVELLKKRRIRPRSQSQEPVRPSASASAASLAMPAAPPSLAMPAAAAKSNNNAHTAAGGRQLPQASMMAGGERVASRSPAAKAAAAARAAAAAAREVKPVPTKAPETAKPSVEAPQAAAIPSSLRTLSPLGPSSREPSLPSVSRQSAEPEPSSPKVSASSSARPSSGVSDVNAATTTSDFALPTIDTSGGGSRSSRGNAFGGNAVGGNGDSGALIPPLRNMGGRSSSAWNLRAEAQQQQQQHKASTPYTPPPLSTTSRTSILPTLHRSNSAKDVRAKPHAAQSTPAAAATPVMRHISEEGSHSSGDDSDGEVALRRHPSSAKADAIPVHAPQQMQGAAPRKPAPNVLFWGNHIRGLK